MLAGVSKRRESLARVSDDDCIIVTDTDSDVGIVSDGREVPQVGSAGWDGAAAATTSADLMKACLPAAAAAAADGPITTASKSAGSSHTQPATPAAAAGEAAFDLAAAAAAAGNQTTKSSKNPGPTGTPPPTAAAAAAPAAGEAAVDLAAAAAVPCDQAAAAADQCPHDHQSDQRQKPSLLDGDSGARHSGSDVFCNPGRGHRKQQQPQSNQARIARWQQQLQQRLRQRCLKQQQQQRQEVDDEKKDHWPSQQQKGSSSIATEDCPAASAAAAAEDHLPPPAAGEGEERGTRAIAALGCSRCRYSSRGCSHCNPAKSPSKDARRKLDQPRPAFDQQQQPRKKHKSTSQDQILAHKGSTAVKGHKVPPVSPWRVRQQEVEHDHGCEQQQQQQQQQRDSAGAAGKTNAVVATAAKAEAQHPALPGSKALKMSKTAVRSKTQPARQQKERDQHCQQQQGGLPVAAAAAAAAALENTDQLAGAAAAAAANCHPPPSSDQQQPQHNHAASATADNTDHCTAAAADGVADDQAAATANGAQTDTEAAAAAAASEEPQPVMPPPPAAAAQVDTDLNRQVPLPLAAAKAEAAVQEQLQRTPQPPAAQYPAAAADGRANDPEAVPAAGMKAQAACGPSLGLLLPRSAATKAQAAFRQQLQRPPKPAAAQDPATAAADARIDQAYADYVTERVGKLWHDRCDKLFGKPGFKPSRPHDVMREDGGILDKARVMETGKLIAQVRHEFDACGPDSGTFEIYNEVNDDGRWSLANDDQDCDGPFCRLLDLKCMINQALVYSCQPVNYRSKPLSDADLLSDCCRAVVTSAKGIIGNELKCTNSNCTRHPTWQRSLYEQRHLKISKEVQAQPAYNSSKHWMFERLGTSLQTFAMAVNSGGLNTVWCIYCKRNKGECPEVEDAAEAAEAAAGRVNKGPVYKEVAEIAGDSLKPCSTCPMACHKACYKAFTGDCDIPEDDTPEDEAFWQCVSCRGAAACAAAGCEYCAEVQPHTIDYEFNEQEYGRIEQQVQAEAEAEAAQAAVGAAAVAAAAGGGKGGVKVKIEGQKQPRKRQQQEQQQEGPSSGSKKHRINSGQQPKAASDSDTDNDIDVAHARRLHELVSQQKPRLSAADLQVDTTVYAGIRLLAASKLATPSKQSPAAVGHEAGTSAAPAAAGRAATESGATAPAASGAAAVTLVAGDVAVIGSGNSRQTAAADEPAGPDVEFSETAAAGGAAAAAPQGTSGQAQAAAAAGADGVPAAGSAAVQLSPVQAAQVAQNGDDQPSQENSPPSGDAPAVPSPALTAPTAPTLAAAGSAVSADPMKERLQFLRQLRDRSVLLDSEYRSILPRVLLGVKQECTEQLVGTVALADAGDLPWEEFQLVKQELIAQILA